MNHTVSAGWRFGAPSFQMVMADHRGVAPGFDFVRLFLALCVVTWHGFLLPNGDSFAFGPLIDALTYLIIPAFFGLSGFLVTGSMIRTRSVPIFLLFRALRIVPALGAETFLAALVLGPATTSFSLGAYFTDAGFVRYFSNIIGLIHFRLPGVFLENPVAGLVNGQLWTIPNELICYAALATLMFTRIAYHRVAMLAVFVVLGTAETATGFLPNRHYTAHVLNSSEMLLLSFLCGCSFFLWRDVIPRSVPLVICAGLVYAAVYTYAPSLAFLPGVLAIVYMTTFVGMLPVPRIPLLMAGDFSYGIYLYSFPVQQTVVWALPGARVWYWNLAIAAPAALIFAMGSWFLLEKPVLSLRRVVRLGDAQK